jgi:hypothetical protein
VNSLVVQVAISLIFVFATVALLASTLTEVIARFLGLRGEYLLRGIRSLVDGSSKFELPDLKDFKAFFGGTPKQPHQIDEDPNITKILTSPIVRSSADKAAMPHEAGNAKLKRQQRRELPSYISARSFARAVFALAVPNVTGNTTLAEVTASIQAMDAGPLRNRLLALVQNADGDVRQFRVSIEQWYDDHMARVSGWYKRHVRWITLAVAAALVISFNVNAVSIGRRLYSDESLRTAVVAQAFQSTDCKSRTAVACLRQVRAQVDETRVLGIPLGWGVVPECVGVSTCSWADDYGLTDPGGGVADDARLLLLLLLGYLLMVIAVLPGAQFWFGLLSRYGGLRSTGPPPPRAESA